MLELVDVGDRSMESYRGIAPDSILDRSVSLGKIFRE